MYFIATVLHLVIFVSQFFWLKQISTFTLEKPSPPTSDFSKRVFASSWIFAKR